MIVEGILLQPAMADVADVEVDAARQHAEFRSNAALLNSGCRSSMRCKCPADAIS